MTDEEILIEIETRRVAGRQGMLSETDATVAESLAIILKVLEMRLTKAIRSSGGMNQEEALRMLTWLRGATLDVTGLTI